MPELPEVETVVRTLAASLPGRTILAAPHVRGDMVRPADFDFAGAVAGRTIVAVRRRAKRIVFELNDAGEFYVHLGMTGQLTIEPPDRPPKPHTHLILHLNSGQHVRLVDPRRFGAIVWLGHAGHGDVGPEPLMLRPAVLHRRLRATKRAVKAALLDQNLIAGIGNIYADEALFKAKLHPGRSAATLTRAESDRLNRAIKLVLRRAIRAGGSSIRDYVDADGRRGSAQLGHRVYDRQGERCQDCRTEIVRIVLGGRSTHFCPACQPVR